MKGYKAFSKGLVCRGKQYAENTVFEEEEAEICKSGMHFCKNPLDVFDYYDLIDFDGNVPEFAEVEALDEPVTDDNKKFCTKKLRVGSKLSLSNFIKIAVDFMCKKNRENIKRSGDCSRLVSSCNHSKLASAGNDSRLASAGDDSQLASAGNCSQLASAGDDSVLAAIGIENCAKGKKGNWITLAEWVKDEKTGKYKPICVKTERIDGEHIKENVFYKLAGGEFTEVKND